jgi:hypothetical protein
MVVGADNPNAVMQLTKMCITNMVNNKKIYVLYNPESYVQERAAKYSEITGINSNMPSLQFVHGSTETLKMELFFDTFTAGAEVGGTAADKNKFDNVSQRSSAQKTDVRDYTSKIYDLMVIDKTTHVPPLLKIEWSSLQFSGHLMSCSQRFTKFNEHGTPVRATLDVVFKEYMEQKKIAEMAPKESPDTAKYRTVSGGDSLWQLSGKEYGDCSNWRMIARANGIENPRLLDSGEMLKIPAL